MKKVLSVLVALALMLGCGVCAGAKAPPPEEAIPQGLVVYLPVVTGIQAVWTGGPLLFDRYPDIHPKTVAVTLTYEGGETETLPYWDGQASDGWWEIVSRTIGETANSVTMAFYYSDEKLVQAYIGGLGDGESYNWLNYLGTLESCTLVIPLNNMENFIEGSRPLTELALDESQPVVLAQGEYKVFSFTPEADGTYCFYSFDNDRDPYGWLVGPDFAIIRRDDDSGGEGNFRIVAALEEGVTYYLIAGAYAQGAGSYRVMVAETDEIEPPAFLLWTNRYVVRYKTYEWIYGDQFVEYYYGYSYQNVLVNGVPLYDFAFYAEGEKTGNLLTLTYTLADGTVLGAVDVVCLMSPPQWITYYLLFGWLWMPDIAAEYAYSIPSFSSLSWFEELFWSFGELLMSFGKVMKVLWFYRV